MHGLGPPWPIHDPADQPSALSDHHRTLSRQQRANSNQYVDISDQCRGLSGQHILLKPIKQSPVNLHVKEDLLPLSQAMVWNAFDNHHLSVLQENYSGNEADLLKVSAIQFVFVTSKRQRMNISFEDNFEGYLESQASSEHSEVANYILVAYLGSCHTGRGAVLWRWRLPLRRSCECIVISKAYSNRTVRRREDLLLSSDHERCLLCYKMATRYATFHAAAPLPVHHLSGVELQKGTYWPGGWRATSRTSSSQEGVESSGEEGGKQPGWLRLVGRAPSGRKIPSS